MSGSGSGEDAGVRCEIRNRIAFVTLDRPSALNALSLPMVTALDALLRRCAHDAQVQAVLLRGAGDKAFCAGGDIRSLYESFKRGDSLHHEFFVAEYALDFLLGSYPKPYVALLDGIVMGGGMGLAQGSRLRVVGERTRMAMPEVGIGLFPDVGASHFLKRCPGAIGTYLALTGAPIGGADAILAGLADVFLPPAAVAALPDRLAALSWSGDAAADLRQLVLAHPDGSAPHAALADMAPVIDRHFSHGTVAAILASLESESGERADWARQTATLMRSRSPTMMAVALEQRQRAQGRTFGECLRMELGMVEACFEQGDFIEGIRALIIDKDRAPRWRPDALAEVTEASVAAFFRARWDAAAHPLRHLEAA